MLTAILEPFPVAPGPSLAEPIRISSRQLLAEKAAIGDLKGLSFGKVFRPIHATASYLVNLDDLSSNWS